MGNNIECEWIAESGINFKFSGNTLKFDETGFYKDSVCKLPETKAVDFLSCFDNSGGGKDLVIMEVKNFEIAGNECRERLSPKGKDALHIEIGQKVRDTLAAITGAQSFGQERNETGDFFEFYKCFCDDSNKRTRIIVVAFIEGDLGQYKKRHKDGAEGLKRKIEKMLKKWLNCDVMVLNSDMAEKRKPKWFEIKKTNYS